MSDTAETGIAQHGAAAASTAREHAGSVSISPDRRRWLQLALAALWLFAGILQYQTYMFSTDFSTSLLAEAAEGNPGWIASSVLWAAHVVEGSPVLVNAAFATLQVGIGLAIAFRPTLRIGLLVSVVWSLLVWWFGEGLGLLLTGAATALTGAPGAVLLYAVLSLLLWPVGEGASASFVASRPIGVPAAKSVWVVLWGGLAALNLQPSQLTGDSVSSKVSGMADGQPTWVRVLVDGFAGVSAGHGTLFSLLGAAIMALVAVGILLPSRWTRPVLVGALVVSAFIWVVGESIGMPFGGMSTDVNSGPLLALMALAYWPGTHTLSAKGVTA